MSFSGGVFSINSTGQPVVSGTTISSTVFNALTADLATGLSTCMLKDGTQTATAGIGFYAGTVSLPGIYFGTDTATGLYRIGLNNTGFAINGTKLLDLSSALVGITGALTVSAGITSTAAANSFGASTFSGALTYGGVTLSNAVTGTGNMVLSASPTLTGTVVGSSSTWSGTITPTGGFIGNNAAATGTSSIQVDIQSTTTSALRWTTSAGGANAKVWEMLTGNNVLTGRTVNDAYNSTASWIEVTRSGTTISSVYFPGVNSTAGFTSTGMNNMPIGASTANTGAFTTLSTSSDAYIGTASSLFSSARMSVLAASSTEALAVKSVTQANNAIITWNSATSGNNSFVSFGTEGTYTERGSITYNRGGGLTAYNTTSDYRAKDVFGLLQNATSMLTQFKVYDGMMHGATLHRPMMIAHEAQAIAPWAVTGKKDEVDADGKPIYQQITEGAFTPLLIAGWQDHEARIKALEEKLQ